MECNQMKMREALLNIQEYAAAMDVDDGNVLAILDACRDALAAPARQCDVGTPEEQAERHKAYCRKHFTPDQLGGNCRKCPLKDRRGWSCQLAWAQTPYAEEGAGE